MRGSGGEPALALRRRGRCSKCSVVTARRVQELRTRLRSAGLRATGPRMAVLEYLIEVGGPVTHGDVAEHLEPSGLDRATVYRNLIDLSDVGILRRADLGDHVWRFELIGEGGSEVEEVHPHFVCNSCGVVACLPEQAITIRAVRGAPRALRRPGLEIKVSGLCDACL